MTSIRNKWQCIEPGRMDYRAARNLQERLIARQSGNRRHTDTLLLLEHPPVFTLGRRGGKENLSVTENFLKTRRVSVVQTERGGNITFHGPGQLVAYPIIDLAAAKLSVPAYVEKLEGVMIQTLRDWGIDGKRNTANRGVWVRDRKIGSIGIALRRFITFHGLALNVDIDLTPFLWINPCGLKNVGMTSMKQELNRAIMMPMVMETIKDNFSQIFKVHLEPKTMDPARLSKMAT
jgi:lipoate-protein ligase B